tara:strand:+ start:79 stop:549 length:471 start_codon:yes stop_codon:yes gene_type:complete
MNTIYSIYIGRKPNGKWKVGCDINYPNRPKEQKMKIYACIETHDCVYMASDREIELQLKYFGKRDSAILYHETLRRAQLARKRNMGSTLSEETKLIMSKAKAGSKNGKALLTDSQVLQIRSKYIPRVYTRKMLAIEYSVSECAIRDVIYRKRWTHI